MKSTTLFVLVVLAGCLSTRAQSNPCANPHDPRVGIFNLAPSKNFEGDVSARYKSADRFVEALEGAFYGACLVKDLAVFGDQKNFPALNGSLMVFVDSAPSFKQQGFVAVSIEFSAVRGTSYTDRIPVISCAVLIEPDDTEVDLSRKARTAIDRYDRTVKGLSTGSKTAK